MATEPLEQQLQADAAQWARPERGSALVVRGGIWLAARIGRRMALRLLPVVAAYYYLFAPTPKRHGAAYLRRVLGRAPRARELFRHVFTFAVTILDRLYLSLDRPDLFELSVEGGDTMREVFASGRGAFLLGSHLGSFPMLSAVGRQQPGLKVAWAIHGYQANGLNVLFRNSLIPDAPRIIPLGQLDAMLHIRDCLDAGQFVGMLADRSIAQAPAQSVAFLGSPALFPVGPMRVAAALRRRVFFMIALYRGGNRYHAVFRELADFSRPLPEGREAAVRAAVARYAALLEEYCRSDPYNWFNFYDFWHGAPPPLAA
ncbi:MAG: acyl-CoA synthetase [Gammaproteobacteria bacterium]|nr:acyl-CoA synthetase [Gammaproteobacteria bacterium]MBV9696643.1 acyl-CoA synthetase [Gammaproteobacteria bacterium]